MMPMMPMINAQAEPALHKKIILLDVAGFLFGLWFAWFSGWQTRDLVWSLWLSSLCIGYATILGVIGAGLYFAYGLMRHESFPKDKRLIFVLIVSAIAIFLLVFFSFHFCGFHAVHASILASFFPLDHVNSDEFGSAFINPPKLLFLAGKNLFPLYGPFLIASAVKERASFLSPLLKVHFIVTNLTKISNSPVAAGSVRKDIGDPFWAPYKNVIRMHCLLFFFALAHFLHMFSFLVFAVAYLVYFFPDKLVLAIKKLFAISVTP